MIRNTLVLALAISALAPAALAATLHVGAHSVSITPDQPVALDGQMHTRIARSVETEVQANALALESREGDTVVEQALFVACGLVAVGDDIYQGVQEILAARIPDFEANKLILSATHTHTGPVVRDGIYEITDPDVMQPSDYKKFLVVRIADAAEAAWKARKPARVGWGMSHAVVAYNRRSYFEDGHAQMYGDISIDSFRGIEGPEDHAVEVLYFWGEQDALVATAVNVVCPSQEVEGRSAINADFWHPVREGLKAKYGQDLVVIGWTGAAGDQSPHIRYRKAAEDRMREFRGLERLDEIARRIILAWEEAYEGAQQDKRDDLPLVHQITPIELPRRIVTEAEYEENKVEIERLAQTPGNFRGIQWRGKVLERYEAQQAGTEEPFTMDLHTLRLGDVAITANPFELFTQFGIQMKAKSPALQTFVIQLAGPGSYVPTPHAAEGGGYSAIAPSNEVGHEGGQVLVDETVKAVKALWAEEE